jgi:acyl dehydratase
MPAYKFAIGQIFVATERLDTERIIAFAQVCGDASPAHLIDSEAQAVGFPRALAHGMLGMALLGRLIEQSFPHSSLKAFRTRFVGMTFHDDLLECGVTVDKIDESANTVQLALSATNQEHQTVLTGTATVLIE